MRDRAWWLRALSPPVIVGAVITAAAVGLPASAAPNLTSKTPADLLSMVATESVAGVSGDVEEKSALGLPALPSTGGTSSAGLTGLLSGTHDLRVWADPSGKFRAQVLDTLDETEVVSDGVNLWTYVYSTNAVSHVVLPARSTHSKPAATATPSPGTVSTPDQLAKKLLSAIDPSTEVTANGTAKIANRDAYLLDVVPRTADTTVGLIRIGIDAATGVPLRVQIFARGASSPALSIGFTKVNFDAVAAAQFTFTPPPGARTAKPATPNARPTDPSNVNPSTKNATSYVVGSGWSSVLVLPHSALFTGINGEPVPTGPGHRIRSTADLGAVLAKAGVRVQGGTLLHTALVNVLAADDGRVLVGAVPDAVLERALTAPAAAG
jgi:outer membrane lipoprotein-sorting protein